MTKTKKRKIKPIGSIRQEKADCIAAFKKYPKATHCWCCHHENLYEKISSDGYMFRISYIMEKKDKEERAVRLRNFRPIKRKKPGRARVKQLNKEWPSNTWGPGNEWSRPSIFQGVPT